MSSVKVAIQNGIKRSTYHNRVSIGWDKERAATTPLKNYKGDYAVYKDDQFVAMGTAEECAEILGVKAESIRFMASNSYKERVALRSNPELSTIVIKLDE